MATFSSTPPAPAERLSFFNVMIKAYTSPSSATFRSLAHNPGASAGQGFLWVGIAAAISAVISAVLLQVFPRNPMLDMLGRYGYLEGFDFGERAVGGVVPFLLSVVCGAPVAAVVAIIFFAITVGLLHLVAGLLGGRGEFGNLVYMLAAVNVPFSILSSLLSPIPYLGCVTFLISLYVLVLQVLAIEGVYLFGVAKAVLTLLIPLIVLCLVVACLAAGIAALLVPVLRDSFRNLPVP